MARLLREMMGDYLTDLEQSARSIESPIASRTTVTRALPIKPKTSTWELLRDPRRLSKTYEFKSFQKYNSFIREILDHESESGHNGKITCEYPTVNVEVTTHRLNDVTELDKKYAKVCDQAYDDVMSYGDQDESDVIQY